MKKEKRLKSRQMLVNIAYGSNWSFPTALSCRACIRAPRRLSSAPELFDDFHSRYPDSKHDECDLLRLQMHVLSSPVISIYRSWSFMHNETFQRIANRFATMSCCASPIKGGRGLVLVQSKECHDSDRRELRSPPSKLLQLFILWPLMARRIVLRSCFSNPTVLIYDRNLRM
jgi:hypothetical protein